MTRSSTDLAIGPRDGMIWWKEEKLSGNPLISPSVLALIPDGLKPRIPQKADGILILPPISDPIEIKAHLAATTPAPPPELPPHVLVISHGFRAQPHKKLSEWVA